MSTDQIILAAALLAVAGILGWGVLTMARGGDYNVKNSNRIMRYRIIFQAIAGLASSFERGIARVRLADGSRLRLRNLGRGGARRYERRHGRAGQVLPE